MRKSKLFLTFFLSTLCFQFIGAQDFEYFKNNIIKLSSAEFHGRGYVKKGDKIASDYIKKQFLSLGIQPVTKSYFQNYSFEVNTFPGKMAISLNGKKLQPARDFVINPASKKISGKFGISLFDLARIQSDSLVLKKYLQSDFSNKFILIDTLGWGKDPFRKSIREAISGNMVNAAGILEVVDTGMIFSVRTFQNTYTKSQLRRKAIPANVSEIQIDVDQKLISHKARNVIGFLPGETDTFIVFTAHYDHLGHMGKDTYYPGANDNASGTSMVLDFAKALAAKKGKHKYSYAFMLFSGEEAGLLGSRYYVENPLFSLSKIKQVLNFDMVAAGSGGVNIFNGSVLKNEFALLDTINKVNNFGLELKAKSTSRSSDHYPFHQKQVPALFILTDGKEVGYHIPQDRFEKLPFNAYQKLFKLIYQYIEAKENGEIIYSTNSDR